VDVWGLGSAGMERGDDCLVQPALLCGTVDSGGFRVSVEGHRVLADGVVKRLADVDARYIIIQLGLLGPLLQISGTVFGEVSLCDTDDHHRCIRYKGVLCSRLIHDRPARSLRTDYERRSARSRFRRLGSPNLSLRVILARWMDMIGRERGGGGT
jgi:hypothetical protein